MPDAVGISNYSADRCYIPQPCTKFKEMFMHKISGSITFIRYVVYKPPGSA